MQTIPKEALEFLSAIKENNNREWFNERKEEFKAIENQMKQFYQQVELLLNKQDDIQRTRAYRFYRDLRFTKDKTPYKKHFAAIFIRRKPGLRGSYYIHIQPGNNSQIGGGFWKPNSADLKRVRKEWELDSSEVREILEDKNFKKHWHEMQGETLKTAPRGFNREHPDIDLINYKQWIFRHQFSDKEVLSEDFATTVTDYYQALRPFFDYMSDVLTTDMNGVSLIE
ncbi:MAG TPA: DUF2461 domain-containing protein [Flavobacteriaceae bacterium]|nr:DUF2461 domain-containing protein [Flavobacteriaceae bacterium]